MDEFYFTLCLKRVLQIGMDTHVDLRNPNLYGSDYIVIDYDGKLYPSDEARMLARIGEIDLSVGTASSGLDEARLHELNCRSFNNLEQDCVHCAFQPYCGIDLIDDLARYARIDRKKHDTWFCRQHTVIFDKIFRFIYRGTAAERYSVARWLGLHSETVELGRRHGDPAAPEGQG